MIDYKILCKEYNENGFCIVPNAVPKVIYEQIFDELEQAKNVVRYVDRKGHIRRLEKIYDKGENLTELNKIFLNLLKSIFNDEFYIFKDKYNAKPPGGEGFFAHYDGVFDWIDANNNSRNGWYCYASKFINVLVAIDECTVENGCLQIAKEDKGTYQQLYANLKKDNECDGIVSQQYEDSLEFHNILLQPGDVVLFSDNAVHRSSKNKSSIDRRTLYYTYNWAKDGDNYNEYFNDKQNTKNKTSQTLSGEI